MSPKKAKLQSVALALRKIPGVNLLYRFWYWIGQRAFAVFAMSFQPTVGAVYLRRGGGRGELVPGASDLDFFLVLQPIPAEIEMAFLKKFWAGYKRWKKVFPFWGEVLMGDAQELKVWLRSASARAHEARFSWRLLGGRHSLPVVPPRPQARDLFSEALKHYADLLAVVLKLEAFRSEVRSHERAALHLRNGAKAALDIFRLHACQREESLWPATRAELAAYFGLPELLPILNLRARGKLFTTDPYLLYVNLLQRSLACLDAMANELSRQPEAAETFTLAGEHEAVADAHALSVRELGAERILLRHPGVVARALVGETNSGVYFLLHAVPAPLELADLLTDLRDLAFSLERSSVAMPLTEICWQELARSSLLDNPFHAFGRQRELRFTGAGTIETLPHSFREGKITAEVLQKTFSELSFGLRFEPRELSHFLEKIVSPVLNLRLVERDGEVSTNFFSAMQRFGARYPARLEHLRARLAPYLPLPTATEHQLWTEIYARLEAHHAAAPERTAYLRSQLAKVQAENRVVPNSPDLPSDLWINLTPFLRMEMNAMKDQFSPERTVLKL